MKTKKEKIVKFIKDNDVKFEVGSRNWNSTFLSGYALYIGIDDKYYLLRIVNEELALLPEAENELERVFDYAKIKSYEDKWHNGEYEDDYIYEPETVEV